MRPKMSRSVRTPRSRPSGSQTKTESPVPVRWIARQAVGQAGARADGHGLPSAEDAQAFVGQGWHATDQVGLGDSLTSQV